MTDRMRRGAGGLAIALLGMITSLAMAQAPPPGEPAIGPAPTLLGLSPLGITADTTAEWTISGRNLDRIERFLISGEGVTVLGHKNKADNALTLTVRADAGAAPGIRELRAESPEGLSNFLLFRVETVPVVSEREPNDAPERATEIAPGAVLSGTLDPRDLDYFRFAGRAGQQVTVEVEALRLGSPVLPVVTLLSANGSALAQGRERRGDRDDRLCFRLPRDGTYLVLVHDFLYGGAAAAGYRLRVSDAPFATALFPLGGPRGQTITLTATGGNLAEPRSRSMTLPDEPGAIVEPGPFDGPGGPVTVRQRLAVADGPEVFETRDGSPTRLAVGTTANGRIARPGEVDRYVLAVKKGDRLRFEVQAAALGSWLDSVLVVRDAQGKSMSESDDQGNPNAAPAGGLFGITARTADSLIDFEAESDGELTLEITDRFGDGGPEYAYRLATLASYPAFTIKLILSNPNAGRTFLAMGAKSPAFATGPGALGALNLKPGTVLPINFLVTPEDRIGRVVVQAEGLPPGVSAEPVTVVFARPPGARFPLPQGGAINLRVAPDAAPALGRLRVIASTRLPEGGTLTRKATATVTIGELGTAPNRPVAVREVTEIPVKVIGGRRPESPPPAGP
jgi:hypothetical protein